ncbi:hypothetical protein [Brunnivagina elsteri]|uniref:Uncharacterized protein n=1 Tax=Brunnivagina elsteri CCALA 953 TaxID=987040 RepID=A0A2A2TFC1_9CYAN|nr:hypothetical protein [Calothrix elsteri]PAX52366.1 hypothetical protein CK510_19675 [Calothrix elsteri CCALA 953]
MFNRWSINIIFCCFVSLPLFNLSIVNAVEIRNGVKQVPQDIATGNSSQKIPQIELSPGYGVNISFIKSGEIVEKVWLDNPAIASLDVDGCLRGLSQQCEQEGATVIHLRRINRLKLPQLPSTSTSLLTVVTKGKSERQVYLFKVVMGDKTPNYHTIEIAPKINIILEITDFLNITNIQSISRGLNIARQQSLIPDESHLWKRIESFLADIKSGKYINNAARDRGISMKLVNRLIELGNREILQQRFINNSR